MKDSDFCPTCKYYLYLDQDGKTLRRICRNCGYQEEDKKGGLVLELTKQDPTLPHVNSIKCPNSGCESNTSGKERDVIYLKYDAVNLKFIYICNVCNTQWRSKS
jgi:DNA-directed RNA polymerase subunit M/transcription elongation factor TFIIS